MGQLSRPEGVGLELLVRRAKRAKQEFTAQLPHSRRASRRERAGETRVFCASDSTRFVRILFLSIQPQNVQSSSGYGPRSSIKVSVF
jgi:hypothetical protein